MAKIKIRNFGAIGKGLLDDDGFMEISKVTVFLGAQGSGKSAVSKLISTFMWLEKALIRGDFEISELTYDVFLKRYLSWQCIESYVMDDTEIEFISQKYGFAVRNKKIDVFETNASPCYARPKITYFPSDRNFCSSIPRPDSVSNILYNLSAVIDDFQVASGNIANESLPLPIGDYFYRYDKDSKRKYVTQKNFHYEIQLQDAASGIQSVVPISVITGYYFDFRNVLMNSKRQVLTVEQKNSIKNLVSKYESENDVATILLYNAEPIEYRYIAQVLNLCGISKPKSSIFVDKTKSIDNSDELVKRFDVDLRKIINSCFISIIEEPEQNLFPNSQKSLVEFLLKSVNRPNNRLVITMHSPYVLGAINNCLYAGNLSARGFRSNDIIDSDTFIRSLDVSAYFIENGEIKSAFDDEIEQINHDLIDGCSRLINSDYERLSELEFS